MGLGIFKKKEKKEDSLPPPPPPIPPKPGVVGDIEDIRPPLPEKTLPKPDFSVPEITMEEESVEIKEPIMVEKREFKEVPVEKPFFAEKPVEIEPPEQIKGPFFVSLNDYNKIERDVKSMETLLEEAEENIEFLHDTLDDEEKLFEKWRSFLEGVEKKLIFVDKIIAKAGE